MTAPGQSAQAAAPTRLDAARLRDDAPVIALVAGEAVRKLPTDLYIPPEALQVVLEAFEGPLDLLLYLIRRHNLNILDIPVAEVTDQYMRYIELMDALQLDLAAEYLLMAAMLAEIKSHMLLPRPAVEDEEEADPRAELARRLQEYEQLKRAAERLDELPRLERDLHLAQAAKPDFGARQVQPTVDLKDLLAAFAAALHRADLYERHAVQLEGLSVRERMSDVLARIGEADGFVPFADLFDVTEGRRGVVVTFLAVMQLMRDALLDVVQSAPFAPLYVRGPGAQDAAAPEPDDSPSP